MRTRTRSQASHNTPHGHAYARARGPTAVSFNFHTHHTYHVSLSAEPPSLKTSHTPDFAHARHSCFVLLRSAYLPVARNEDTSTCGPAQHDTLLCQDSPSSIFEFDSPRSRLSRFHRLDHCTSTLDASVCTPSCHEVTPWPRATVERHSRAPISNASNRIDQRPRPRAARARPPRPRCPPLALACDEPW